jgi:hypothetical protein
VSLLRCCVLWLLTNYVSLLSRVSHACSVEHRGAVLNLLPIGDYTAKGTYAAKAWKVRG